ncbi:hypothetical protein NDU88_004988 [Pleurodeles waltl]|uniref:Uncharacterized protein n=1 Tax=Pleurodeles waltl TaxID=8319 RepID=A0AAV7LMX5_PLEWA|nr:hypothetical protein NDU88_004988 [Pleurodeles waltl]
MGTGYPDMCFCCKEVGVAGWNHVIATCRCIQGYWDGIFAMLTTMVPVSTSPSIQLMILGYDPEARLSSRWEKLVFIATAVARGQLVLEADLEESLKECLYLGQGFERSPSSPTSGEEVELTEEHR